MRREPVQGGLSSPRSYWLARLHVGESDRIRLLVPCASVWFWGEGNSNYTSFLTRGDLGKEALVPAKKDTSSQLP